MTAAGSDAVLERLTRLHPKLIDLSLGRTERILSLLDNPHRHFPPVVHIAGTNGKGSTLAYLRAACEAAGLRVHAYTSPHLVRFHERIRVAGELIAEDALIGLLEEAEAANGGEPITFFEITTAAAFLAFSRTPADVLLLETGLGGRLDSTNVMKRPALTVITPISHDHAQFLGDTLPAIAREKAGIMKPAVPCVLAAQDPAAREPFLARAQDVGCALFEENQDWRIAEREDGFIYEGPMTILELPKPALPGAFQVRNAGLAVAALDRLRTPRIATQHWGEGLTGVQWPGRLQRLTRGPLTDALPGGCDLWLDGGHNRSAGHALASEITAWKAAEPGRPVHLVCGMLNSKDAGAFLAPLAALADSLQTVAIPGEENTLTAAELAAMAGGAAVPADSVAAALEDIARRTSGPARVLICGSLYLAGTVLAENA